MLGTHSRGGDGLGEAPLAWVHSCCCGAKGKIALQPAAAPGEEQGFSWGEKLEDLPAKPAFVLG